MSEARQKGKVLSDVDLRIEYAYGPKGRARASLRSRALQLFVSVALVVPLVVTATTRSASAATTTFLASADAQVQEANSGTNYGTSTTLRVDGGSDPDVETYLRFAVSGTSGTVQAATLRLWVGSDSTADGPAVYTTADTWAENSITWTNRTPRVGTGVDNKGSIPTNAYVEFNVTSLVTGNGTYNLVLAGTSTDGINFSSREATTNQPQLVVTTATSTDTKSPTPPTLSATPASATRVDLSWTGATDNIGVTGYEIYRNGSSVPLATVGAVASYADTTVTGGLTYTYKVKAKDAAGNLSVSSNTASATTPSASGTTTFIATADAQVQEATPSTNYGTSTALRVDAGTDPDVESYLKFSASGLSGSLRSAKLRVYASSGTADGPPVFSTGTSSWTETGITWSNRPGPISGATGDKAGISTGTWVEYDVTTLITGNGTWAFRLAGTSTDGVDFHSREGVNKPQLVITMGAPDTKAPTAPAGLKATAGSPTQVDLSWTASTDDVAVTGYDIYRGGTFLKTIGAVTSYSDTTVKASTAYSYTVRARDGAGNVSGNSNTANVTTPSAGGSTVTIAAAGDIACANTDASYNGGAGTSTACHELYTSNLLTGAGYAAVLPLGDNQYNSGSLTQYNAVYNPTWGRVKSISHPVVGNHEYGTPNASGYFTYFGSAAGDPSKGYYSYDIGSWHVIALNSNCSIVACTKNSAQERWLQSDLSAHPAACTLAYSHHARWSSGHDGDNTFMQPLWQDLYDGGADVLLSGHSHNYERFAPQNASGALDNTGGIRQFVVGTGGAFFTGIGTPHANSQVRQNTSFGILKMTLRATSYDWQFIPDSGGTFTDSGSTSCH